MNEISRSLGALQRALDAVWQRDRAVRSNLAHLNTPGYKRVEVRFESLLAERLGRGPVDPAAFQQVQPKVVVDASPGRADGNNVQLEREIADLERNRIHFEALTEITSMRIQGMRNAITSR